jgi:hypothetical protein
VALLLWTLRTVVKKAFSDAEGSCFPFSFIEISRLESLDNFKTLIVSNVFVGLKKNVQGYTNASHRRC